MVTGENNIFHIYKPFEDKSTPYNYQNYYYIFISNAFETINIHRFKYFALVVLIIFSY